MTKLSTATLIASAFSLFAISACSKASWQEDQGRGAPNQQQTQNPTPQIPSAPGTTPVVAPKPAPAVPGHLPPAGFAACASQTLTVEVGTAKTDSNLTDFFTTTARFPQIKVTQAAKTRSKTTFYLNADDINSHACVDDVCAEAAGWTQIQDDLMDLNDVTVTCMGAPVDPNQPPVPRPTPTNSGSGPGQG